MTVFVQSTPTVNSTSVRILFMGGGRILQTLDPGQSDTLTFTFDMIGVAPPTGGPPIAKRQNPPGQVTVPVGNIATVSQLNQGAIGFVYLRPGGTSQTVIFV